ncbi:unnamed protein product [Adineta steineri]|uniref:Peptidase metallopeptidase domain-containing protein n=1 Tax=Adineta steineri TaxID=433720 RepID=A0A813PGS1_9BILA|nr:unnamed protein product [Adineta steineri]
MNRPHCGNADFQLARMGMGKWSGSSLTWSLRSHPQQLSRERALALIQKAFDAWSVHIPLQIKACSTCKADFTIEAGSYQHGCNGGSFDGPNGVLAHAFLPTDGRIHFDADEPWTEESNGGGINFYSVAVHEIGHALGLNHNNNQNSIMFPSYIPSLNVHTLPDIDRRSIQEVYGASNGGGSNPSEPDACK